MTESKHTGCGCASAIAAAGIKGGDQCSFSNHKHVRITHAHISLATDFATKRLFGSVEYTVEVLTAGTPELIVDWRKLAFKGVQLIAPNGSITSLGASFSQVHEVFGSALHIHLPEDQRNLGHILQIRVLYETDPTADAIQWLEPEQTEGKKHPYLFTQCQAIHCRTLIPIQDTPGNKITYSAAITVPAPLVALMSAVEQKAAETAEDKKSITYFWEQKVPIPSYLIALAVGDLKKKDIGPRSCVWTEEPQLLASATEFSDTEQFICAIEEIAGPYVWGRYDLLVLPKSFPYGGMENPCLTYVTPTLLAGDKTLVNVVAHEIAHSWTGNLVTCDTWEHFWLNEGFTVYLERKCAKAVAGGGAKGDLQLQLQAAIGDDDLLKTVASHKPAHTIMTPDLLNTDPDEVFSSVPYEKGFQLLYYLETEVVKSEDLMNEYLKDYVKTFARKTLTTQDFQDHFIAFFKGLLTNEEVLNGPRLALLREGATNIAAVDWKSWYNHEGMPLHKPTFHASEYVVSAKALATSWADSKDGAEPSVDIKEWSCPQKLVFLDSLVNLQKQAYTIPRALDVEQKVNTHQLAIADAWALILKKMDAKYHLTASKNAEIRHRWLTLCVRAEMESCFDNCCDFLSSNGRGKFIRPLYADLHKSIRAAAKPHGGVAKELFARVRSMYHPIGAKWVEDVLKA